MTQPKKTPASARGVVRANAMIRGGGNNDPHDRFTTLADALCDLRHWADRHGVDFHEALDKSYKHYVAEAIEPDDLAMQEF
jgi:hypothetical protein